MANNNRDSSGSLDHELDHEDLTVGAGEVSVDKRRRLQDERAARAAAAAAAAAAAEAAAAEAEMNRRYDAGLASLEAGQSSIDKRKRLQQERDNQKRLEDLRATVQAGESSIDKRKNRN